MTRHHPHSYTHINEIGYQAVRKAIFPGFMPRDRDGRFVSRVKVTAGHLREELARANNIGLEQAIARTRQSPMAGE